MLFVWIFWILFPNVSCLEVGNFESGEHLVYCSLIKKVTRILEVVCLVVEDAFDTDSSLIDLRSHRETHRTTRKLQELRGYTFHKAQPKMRMFASHLCP